MQIIIEVEGKEINISTDDNTSEVERLTILQSALRLVGNDDFASMVDDYIKIGKAYKDFYKDLKPEEPSEMKPLNLPLKYHSNGYKEEVLLKEEQPEHFKTGIVEDDGIKKYKCRLHCDCGNHQNVYIDKMSKTVICPNCDKPHQVRDAKESGFPNRDAWGNYYIAGVFVGEDE